ncbi:MAG: lptD [Gammaproteobacteria bacterium]|nr:lptD [Gammaproteobacteria bacterium]
MKKKFLIITSVFASGLLIVSNLGATTDRIGGRVEELEAKQLGWLFSNNSPSLCRGYYQEPVLALFLPPGLTNDQFAIKADSGSYVLNGQTTVSGHVVIAEQGRRITADKAQFYSVNPQQKIIDLQGNVMMREPNNLLIAKKAHYILGQSQGSLDDVLYRWSLGTPSSALSADQKQRLLYGLIGWGKAQKAEQQSKTLVTLYNSNFTTCTPQNVVWQLHTRQLTLNRETGRGTAKNMVLKIKDIPVFYTPYFNFPIDKRRQSGFLFGTYGYSNQSGVDINIPYYWNIAPNYDVTITPRIMEKRGMQLNGLFRYLTPMTQGTFALEDLPNDKIFQSFRADAKTNYPASPLLNDLLATTDNRYLFHWHNDTRFNDKWSSTINVTKVSDDYYFQDLGSNPNAINDSQLIQQAELNYTDTHWSFLGRLQQVQTLHPINRPFVPDQYSRLPQLLLTANYPQIGWGLNYNFSSEFVHFDRPRDPITHFIYPTGNRFSLRPSFSLPSQTVWGYVTPTLQLELTHYDISNAIADKPKNINRILPIFNIDGGLYFTRTTRLLGQSYEQTLEPRIFYLYVPYVKQADIPVFDGAWQPLTFAQLFSTNRFTGIDHIGDANQVTLALTTRFVDQDRGIEKLRASIGQIYYFQNRRVELLDPSTPAGMLAPQSQLGALSSTAQVSPLIGEINYYIANNWHLIVNGGYDVEQGKIYSAGANFQYMPGAGRLFNLGYNFIRKGDLLPNGQLTDLNMADVSFAWPLLSKQWKLIGRWNYNLGQSHVQNAFSGLEYNTCCWAIRFIANKSFTAFNEVNNPQYNTGFYLQLQLKGLGNFSTSDPKALLMNGISGYQNNFGEI